VGGVAGTYACGLGITTGRCGFQQTLAIDESGFSRALPKTEYRSNVRQMAGERGIWQRHFWEHLIRDETDFERHVDYVHVNPVKHGLVSRVIDWPYSNFHRYVEKGVYPENWGGDLDLTVAGDN